MLTLICFVGACLTFSVLFPVNATCHGMQSQSDLHSFSNINKDYPGEKNRYYAHVFIGWIFFSEWTKLRIPSHADQLGFVMWLITRETIYFINLRHAYLLAPFNAARISSRTVLFTDVPVEYQSQAKLPGLFGASMKRSWLVTDSKDLQGTVEERDKDAMKLEGAEVKLSQTANKVRLKWEKKNEKKEPASENADAEAATPGSRWVNKKDRPTHRLDKTRLIGKKVYTIDWTRSEVKRLVPEIEKSQITHRNNEGKLLSVAFVEFNTQQAAEAAFRRMSPRKAPKMDPRTIGATPGEIVCGNLRYQEI
jgi:hypothetical protein